MISIVIPLYNAIEHIEALIDKLAEQTIAHELILIDSSSTDGTTQWLNERSIPFTSIPKETFNHGTTRNLGVSLSTGDYVIMLTQDALPVGFTTLEKLVEILDTQEAVSLVYGRQLPYPNATPLSKFARYTNYPSTSQIKSQADISHLGIRTCHCSNSFAAYRKSALVEIGGFPTDVILGEDVVVGAQFILKGLSIAYCGSAEVIHSHNYTVEEEFKRYFDIGVFHQQQRNLLQPFLKAESEGFKYVISEWRYLNKQNQLLYIPNQLIRTVAKYMGYRLGRAHHKMPNWIKFKISMHKSFWEKSK
jgi:rhamnosyltransferase